MRLVRVRPVWESRIVTFLHIAFIGPGHQLLKGDASRGVSLLEDSNVPIDRDADAAVREAMATWLRRHDR